MNLGLRLRPTKKDPDATHIGSPVGQVSQLQIVLDNIRRAILVASQKGVNYIESFAHFDTDKSGTISIQEFNSGLTAIDIVLSPKYVKAIVEKYGITIKGSSEKEVPYARFLKMLSLDAKEDFKAPAIQISSSLPQSEDDQSVTDNYSDIIRQLQQIGKDAIEQAVDHDVWVLFESHDQKSIGRIPYSEFTTALVSLGVQIPAATIDEIAHRFADHSGQYDEEDRPQIRYREFLGCIMLGEVDAISASLTKHKHDPVANYISDDESTIESVDSEVDSVLLVKEHAKQVTVKLREILRVSRRRGLDYREVFERYDDNYSGFIPRSEFEDGLRTIGIRLSQEQLNCVVKAFEGSQGITSTIDYRSFILQLQEEENLVRSTLHRVRETLSNHGMDRIRMTQCFENFDRNHDGVVDQQEFTTGMQRLRIDLKENEIIRIMDTFKRDLRHQDIGHNQTLVNGLILVNNTTTQIYDRSDFITPRSMESESPRYNDSPRNVVSATHSNLEPVHTSQEVLYKEMINMMFDANAAKRDQHSVLRDESIAVLSTLRENIRLASLSGVTMEECFMMYDLDGSGDIDLNELHRILNSLVLSNVSLECSKHLLGMFETVPGSGIMNYFDFIAMVQQHNSGTKGSFKQIDKFEIVCQMRHLVDQAEMEGNSHRQCFTDFDTDGNGQISSLELLRGLRMLHLFVSEDEVDRVMNDFATRQGGMSYNDFLRLVGITDPEARTNIIQSSKQCESSIDLSTELSDEQIKKAEELVLEIKDVCSRVGSGIDVQEHFEEFDSDFSGVIDEYELQEGLEHLGFSVDLNNLRLVLQQYSLYDESSFAKGVIQVDYPEFLALASSNSHTNEFGDHKLELALESLQIQVGKLLENPSTKDQHKSVTGKQHLAFDAVCESFAVDQNGCTSRKELHRGLLTVGVQISKTDASRVMRLLEPPESRRQSVDSQVTLSTHHGDNKACWTDSKPCQKWNLNFELFKQLARPLLPQVTQKLTKLGASLDIAKPQSNVAYKVFINTFENYDKDTTGTVPVMVFHDILNAFGWIEPSSSNLHFGEGLQHTKREFVVEETTESKLLRTKVRSSEYTDAVLSRSQIRQVENYFGFGGLQRVNYRRFIRFLQSLHKKVLSIGTNDNAFNKDGNDGIGTPTNLMKGPPPAEQLRTQDDTFKRLLWNTPAQRDKDIEVYDSNYVFTRNDIRFNNKSEEAEQKKKDTETAKVRQSYQKWKLQKDVLDEAKRMVSVLGEEWADEDRKWTEVCGALASTELLVRFHDVGLGSLKSTWIDWCKEHRSFEGVPIQHESKVKKILQKYSDEKVPDMLPLLRFNKEIPITASDSITKQSKCLNAFFVSLCSRQWEESMKISKAKVVALRAEHRLEVHQGLVEELKDSEFVDEDDDSLWYLPQFADKQGMKSTIGLLSGMGPARLKTMHDEQQEQTRKVKAQKTKEKQEHAKLMHEKFIRNKDKLRIVLPTKQHKGGHRGRGYNPPSMRVPHNPESRESVSVRKHRDTVSHNTVDIARKYGMKVCHANNISDLHKSRQVLLDKGYVIPSNFCDEDGDLDHEEFRSVKHTQYENGKPKVMSKKRKQAREFGSQVQFSLWKAKSLAVEDGKRMLRHLPAPLETPPEVDEKRYWSQVAKASKSIDHQKMFGSFVAWSKGFKSLNDCKQLWNSVSPKTFVGDPAIEWKWNQIKSTMTKIANRRGVQYAKVLDTLAAEIAGRSGNPVKLRQRMERYLTKDEFHKYLTYLGFSLPKRDEQLLLAAFSMEKNSKAEDHLLDAAKFRKFTGSASRKSVARSGWRSDVTVSTTNDQSRELSAREQVHFGLQLANAPAEILNSTQSDTRKLLQYGLVFLSAKLRETRVKWSHGERDGKTASTILENELRADLEAKLRLEVRNFQTTQLSLAWSSVTELSSELVLMHDVNILFYLIEVSKVCFNSEPFPHTKKIVHSTKDPAQLTSPPTEPKGEAVVRGLKPNTAYFCKLSAFYHKGVPPVVVQKRFMTLPAKPPAPVLLRLKLGDGGSSSCELGWDKEDVINARHKGFIKTSQQTSSNTPQSTLTELPALKKLFRTFSVIELLESTQREDSETISKVTKLLPLSVLQDTCFLTRFSSLVAKKYTGDKNSFPTNGALSSELLKVGRHVLLTDATSKTLESNSSQLQKNSSTTQQQDQFAKLVLSITRSSGPQELNSELWEGSEGRSAYVVCTLSNKHKDNVVMVRKSRATRQPHGGESYWNFINGSTLTFPLKELNKVIDGSTRKLMFKLELFVEGDKIKNDVLLWRGTLSMTDWIAQLGTSNNWDKEYVVQLTRQNDEPVSSNNARAVVRIAITNPSVSNGSVLDRSTCLSWDQFQQTCQITGFLTAASSNAVTSLQQRSMVKSRILPSANARFLCNGPRIRNQQKLGLSNTQSTTERNNKKLQIDSMTQTVVVPNEKPMYELLCEAFETNLSSTGKPKTLKETRSTLYMGHEPGCTVSGLQLGMTFQFRVRARNLHGGWSEVSEPTIVSAMIAQPKPPVLLAEPKEQDATDDYATVDSCGEFRLTWEEHKEIMRKALQANCGVERWSKVFASWESQYCSTNSHIVYVVRISRNSGPFRIAYQGTRASTTLKLLEPNSSYRINVRVEDRGSVFPVQSPWSNDLRIRTAPSPPSQPSVVHVGSTDVVLRWHEGVNGAVRYVVEAKFIERLGQVALNSTSNQRSKLSARRSGPWTKVYRGIQPMCHLKGMLPLSAYRFRVFTENENGVLAERSSLVSFAVTTESDEPLNPSNATEKFTIRCNEDIVLGDCILFTERVSDAEVAKVATKKSSKTIYRSIAARVTRVSNASSRNAMKSSGPKLSLTVLWCSVSKSRSSKRYKLESNVVIHRRMSDVLKSNFGVFRMAWCEEGTRWSSVEEQEVKANKLKEFRMRLAEDKVQSKEEWAAFKGDRARECKLLADSIVHETYFVENPSLSNSSQEVLIQPQQRTTSDLHNVQHTNGFSSIQYQNPFRKDKDSPHHVATDKSLESKQVEQKRQNFDFDHEKEKSSIENGVEQYSQIGRTPSLDFGTNPDAIKNFAKRNSRSHAGKEDPHSTSEVTMPRNGATDSRNQRNQTEITPSESMEQKSVQHSSIANEISEDSDQLFDNVSRSVFDESDNKSVDSDVPEVLEFQASDNSSDMFDKVSHSVFGDESVNSKELGEDSPGAGDSKEGSNLSGSQEVSDSSDLFDQVSHSVYDEDEEEYKV